MMENRFGLEHCSRWGGIPQEGLKDAHRLHIEILRKACGTGVWNIPVNWEKVGHADFGVWAYSRFTYCGHLATFDSAQLTRLVFLAHSECVRVEVSPKAFRYLEITLHSGRGREGSMGRRHPTLDQAVESFQRDEAQWSLVHHD